MPQQSLADFLQHTARLLFLAATRPATAARIAKAQARSTCAKRAKFNSGRSLFPLPTPRVSIPNAIREQPSQIGEIWVTVVVEAEAFAIFLARLFAIPHLPPRIIRVEVRTTQRLPAAMRTAFDVAASAMTLADGSGAIPTGSERLAHEYLGTHISANALLARIS